MLDFNEIQPSKQPSIDTEAFEKFAKQFFEELLGGVVEKGPGRGPDDGIDLKVRVGTETWLVSCKHWRSRAVNMEDESPCPAFRLNVHGCDRFVGFYSCTPSAALNRAFESLATRIPGFKFTIFYDRDIERELLSSQTTRGWLLAARWFPKSYSKIFSQIVHPLKAYTHADLRKDDVRGKLRIKGIGLYALYQSPASMEAASADLIRDANEIETGRAFDTIFVSRLAELAAAFPGSLMRTRFAKQISTSEIFPSWDFTVLVELLTQRSRLRAVHAICIVWSIWHADRARKMMHAASLMHSLSHVKGALDVRTEEEAFSFYRNYWGIPIAEPINNSNTAWDLSFSRVAALGTTLERGYFAGLLAFHPGTVLARPPEAQMIVRIAANIGELEPLRSALKLLLGRCNREDREYVLATGKNDVEFLTSLHNCPSLTESNWRDITEQLQCFSQPMLEPWFAEAVLNPDLLRFWQRA